MFKPTLFCLLLQIIFSFNSLAITHPDLNGLIEFYQLTDGENWSNNTGWKEGVEGISCDPCNFNGLPWYGLRCENDRVTQMDMAGFEDFSSDTSNPTLIFGPGNNLKGVFPQIYLNELKFLKLSMDSLTGPMPNFEGLPKLEYLITRFIRFQEIPDLSLTPGLKVLYVNHGSMNGTVPDFTSLPNLERLHLPWNAYTFLPDFQNMPQLQHLELTANPFEMEIPDFSNFPNLKILELQGCLLEGPMPSFEKMISLETFSCTSCDGLTGKIQDLSHLPYLKELTLGNNKLEGCYPEFICSLDLFLAQNNSGLPWGGNHLPFCDGEDQIGATCTTTETNMIGVIDSLCNCIALIDLDGDGFYSTEDCDDENAMINPGVLEVPYNGLDDDCNPDTLDDDLDQDGFTLEDDCDDTNADINPDAIDIPNNDIDEDCDGEISTSTKEISTLHFSLFPNPCQDHINIQIYSDANFEINIYNSVGEIILKGKSLKNIDISSLNRGLHLMEIIDQKTQKKGIQKFMVY